MKILLISSISPYRGPGAIVLEMKKALELANHEVTILTKYREPSLPFIKSVFPPINVLRKYIDLISWNIKLLWQRPNYFFFYRSDKNPPVSTRKVLKAIDDNYDMVYIWFYQDLLSFKTIYKLYEKLKVPFLFSPPDYSIMTGGCHFMNNCLEYTNGCKKCKGIKFGHFPRKNVIYRNKVLDIIKPKILCNSYMQSRFLESTLFKMSDNLYSVHPIIDLDVFCERDGTAIKIAKGIEPQKKVLLFGAQELSNERKGIRYLIQALNVLYDRLPEDYRRAIQIVSIGKKNTELTSKIKFNVLELGYLKFTELPDIYAMASIYLSPSVVDAGPLMVNQALACGTPVVSFEIGTAIEVIKNQGTGYCAKVRDYVDFANGIYKILMLSTAEYSNMRRNCRKISIDTVSYANFAKVVENAYNDFKNGDE